MNPNMPDDYKPKTTNGACVRLVFGKHKYVVPISEDFSLTASQSISQPIKELFDLVKNAVSGANFTGGTLSSFAKLGMDIQDLVGARLGGREYYINAWKGVKENGIDLKLEFKWGWMGEWNAKTECYDPAMKIFSKTLPGGNNAVITAPMPAPWEVYTSYGAHVITSAIDATINGIGSMVSSVFSTSTASALDTEAKKKVENTSNPDAIWGSLGKTWNVEYGFFSDDTFVSLIDIGPCIVETSHMNQVNQMQEIDSKMYPISTTISLSMKAQDVFIESQFARI